MIFSESGSHTASLNMCIMVVCSDLTGLWLKGVAEVSLLPPQGE